MESNGKGLGKKVFREYIILWIIMLTIFGVLLICVGYNITETNYWAWAKIPCISIGSSLLGIGLVSIAFKATSISLMEDEIMKDVVRTTLEETEHTFIPKMIGLSAHISVRIVSSENNNRPKMVICEQKTLKNLHDLPVTQRPVKMSLNPHQTCELNSIEVNVGTKSKKFTPTLKLEQSRVISLE